MPLGKAVIFYKLVYFIGAKLSLENISLVWGPVSGSLFYLGWRLKLK